MAGLPFLLALHIALLLLLPCSCQVGDSCSSARDCGAGLYCGNCAATGKTRPSCIRDLAIQPTSIVKGLPFNRYSWLVTHNSFSIIGEPPHLVFLDLSYNNLSGPIPASLARRYNVVGNPLICEQDCYRMAPMAMFH